jgi:transposase InsO family protein/transposase-like protein
MGSKKKHTKSTTEVGGSPLEGGRPKTGTSRKTKKKRKKKTKKRGKTARRTFTLEERLAAIEAYRKSGLPIEEFSRLWDLSKATLGNWLRKYEQDGPKGLARKPHAGKGKSRLAKALKTEIVRAKSYFPDFGLKKIRDYLVRFRGVKVSPKAIQRTLETEALPPAAKKKAKKKRKKKKPARRFERSKPGSLWQSDITSFLLTRNSVRVYLTVFMDDFSRYIVSYALALHQKQGLVIEALLNGIERFGKPKEVLTDQGRQYFTWRGKNSFQKLLQKQGIKHVVARSHHPQTVGKCERFWKTVQEEFWSRVNPQELEEARERLSHFISHYNHTRPHQGIDGLIPADRFFGAESEVRQALEAQLAENELRLALGEAPRRSVYLVGRIGDQEVSMHGERGKLVIHGPEKEIQELDADQLGMAQEVADVRANDTGGEEAKPAAAALGEDHHAQPYPPASAWPMGMCLGRGEGMGAPGGGGDPGDVAGAFEPSGGVGAPGGPGDPDLAALETGADRDAERALETAQEEAQNDGSRFGGASVEAAGEGSETSERGGEFEKPGEAAEGFPSAPGEEPGQGGGSCPARKSEKEDCPQRSSGPSEEDYPPRTPQRTNEKPWPKHTESENGPCETG